MELLVVWVLALAILAGLLGRSWSVWLGLVDLRRHLELLGSGLEILRRNKRPLWVLLCAAVAGWTGWLLGVWRDPSGIAAIEDLLAKQENSAVGFAATHALTTSVGPLLPFLSLGDLLPLVVCGCVLLFARAADIGQDLRGGLRPLLAEKLKRRLGTIWLALVVLMAYRTVVFITDPYSSPMGGCIFIDSILVPLCLLSADGLLLSWVLTEFGRGLQARFDWHRGDTIAFVSGVVPSMMVCGLSNPGRYVLLGGAMMESQLNMGVCPASRWVPLVWGMAIAQTVGLAWLGLPGVLAVRPEAGMTSLLGSYVRLWQRAGGRLVGISVLAVLLNLAVTMPVYWVFGAMQPESWSLLGAASYGYYIRLLVGLVVLGAVIELAHQELGSRDELFSEGRATDSGVRPSAQPAEV